MRNKVTTGVVVLLFLALVALMYHNGSPIVVVGDAERLRVGIVIVMTPTRMNGVEGDKADKLDVMLAIWNCYALRHGYSVFYVPFPFHEDRSHDPTAPALPQRSKHTSELAQAAEFYLGRTRVFKRYLSFVDIMLAIDGDTSVVNHTVKLEHWLGSEEHVGFQIRQNGGVGAGMMFARK